MSIEGRQLTPDDISASEQAPDSLTEQRESPFERLEAKIAVVTTVLKRIDALADVRDSSAVTRSLDELWSSLTMLMPAEAMTKFEALQVIEERLQALNRTNRDNHDVVPFSADHVLTTREQKTRLRHEARSLMEDEDVLFIMNIDSVLKSLRYKHAELSRYRQEPGATLAAVNRRMGEHPLTPKDIQRVVETPFDTTFVLTNAAYDAKRDPDSMGMHFEHSPYSVVRQRDGVEQTIRHERVHNILERADSIGDFTDQEKWEGFQKAHANATTESERQKIEETLATFRPEQLLDRMHDELLANLEAWESRGMPEEKIPDTLPSGIDMTFVSYAMGYSTAGFHAALIAKTYNRVANRCTSPERKQQLLTIGAEFQWAFTRTIEHLKRACLRAAAMGEETLDRLHALCFILPPSKYRHLERYLETVENKAPENARDSIEL